jgi:hypothetical protein
MPFIIYCLPRSRSAWLTHFLNYPMARPLQRVAHDVAPLCRSVENFIKAYKEEGMWGSVELGGIIGWQVIRKEMPNLKTVVVKRPLQEVYNSIVALGLQPDLTALAEHGELLDVVGSQPGVYTISSESLDSPMMCKWLFEYCLELEFDFEWWAHLAPLNIQVDVDGVMKVKGEIDERMELYKKDVLERMKEINNCLH